jgi:hypothetical protein
MKKRVVAVERSKPEKPNRQPRDDAESPVVVSLLDQQQTSANASHDIYTTCLPDLEAALHRVARLGPVEVLSDTVSVQFRVGHAGDASTIASWYYDTEDCSEPQVCALADALGDERSLPLIFAFLGEWILNGNADASSQHLQEPQQQQLAAMALLTLAWRRSRRVLRVEWWRVDNTTRKEPLASLLQKRLWLRLSAIALATGCEMELVNKTTACNNKPEPLKSDGKQSV